MSVHSNSILDQSVNAPGFFDNPYPVYQRLRSEDPVHWSELWQAWVVTRYDDVMAILRDPDHFSNAGRQARLLDRFPAEAQAKLQPLAQHYATGGLINSDPPTHTRLRALINKAFTPRMVEHMRARIQEIVDELLNAVLDKEQMDAILDLAYPLPAIVIAEMLGAPKEDRDRFKIWSEDINAFLGTGRPRVDYADRAQQSLLEMKAYMRHLLTDRQQQPQDDLLTGLATAEEQGHVLGEDELLATCVTLLIAGHETTTNLIGNGLLALFDHPDQLEKLKDDPSLIHGAVEEVLRYDGPVHSLKRVTTGDVEFGGRQIKKGELVYAMLGAANRDPAQFSKPNLFNITRSRRENRHIAFGYGIHFCLGAPLARLEAPIALNAMLQRLEGLRPAQNPPIWQKNMSIRGLASLPVRFGKVQEKAAVG